jgi:hypothetical protein
MFYGDFSAQMQMVGLMLVSEKQQVGARGATQRPGDGLREKLRHALNWPHRAALVRRTSSKTKLMDLAHANQALEARIVKLEQQVAAVVAAQS